MTSKSLHGAKRGRHSRDVGVRRHRQERQDVRHFSSAVRRPAMLRFLSPGTVVMAEVPFREAEGFKFRPVVVVSVHADSVQVLPCTGSARRHSSRTAAVELRDLASAGLPRATAVRRELIRLGADQLGGVVGVLSDEDWNTVLPTVPAWLPAVPAWLPAVPAYSATG